MGVGLLPFTDAGLLQWMSTAVKGLFHAINFPDAGEASLSPQTGFVWPRASGCWALTAAAVTIYWQRYPLHWRVYLLRPAQTQAPVRTCAAPIHLCLCTVPRAAHDLLAGVCMTVVHIINMVICYACKRTRL